jgi:hypothetical protein
LTYMTFHTEARSEQGGHHERTVTEVLGDAAPAWIEVRVGLDKLPLARARLGSVPYALRAAWADEVALRSVGPANVSDGFGLVPVGAVLPFAGPVVPVGWLLCDGGAVNRQDYPALFAAIGVAHGTGRGWGSLCRVILATQNLMIQFT